MDRHFFCSNNYSRPRGKTFSTLSRQLLVKNIDNHSKFLKELFRVKVYDWPYDTCNDLLSCILKLYVLSIKGTYFLGQSTSVYISFDLSIAMDILCLVLFYTRISCQ